MANSTDDRDFATFLRGDALENAVSVFDGFARQLVLISVDKATVPEQAQNLSFQNITKARERVRHLFGFDFADSITTQAWDSVDRCFHKRHLLAHRMGVVDQVYIDATGDQSTVLGRKVPIEQKEIEELMVNLEKMGQRMKLGLD